MYLKYKSILPFISVFILAACGGGGGGGYFPGTKQGANGGSGKIVIVENQARCASGVWNINDHFNNVKGSTWIKRTTVTAHYLIVAGGGGGGHAGGGGGGGLRNAANRLPPGAYPPPGGGC